MTRDALLTLDEIFGSESDMEIEASASDSDTLSDFHRFFEHDTPEPESQDNGYDGETTDEDGTVDVNEIPSDAPLSLYFQQMGQVPLLTKDEEVELAKRVERGRKAKERLAEGDVAPKEIEALQRHVEDGQAARRRLAEANTRLVVSVAKKYRGYGLPFLDLIQAGNVGLMRAIDRFDHRRGYKFSTYATWWIRQAVTRSLNSNKRTIRIPVHKDGWIRRLKKVSNGLEQKMGRRPTLKEIAQEMGESPAKVRKVLHQTQHSVSLNKPAGNDGDEGASELGSFIEDTTLPSPSETVEREMLRDQLEEMVASLKPREAWVLRMRFGLHGNRKHTFKELGQKLNLSKERIRQIQSEALRKLRHPTFRRHLDDYR